MESKWYKNVYRRNLVDMHIEDWDDEFLSQFSAEEYYQNLVKANIESPMIYLQSHTGLCNFDTNVAQTHRAFKNKEEIQKLIKLCKKGGMKVVGYYSLIFNTFAEIHHKDWAMVYSNGESWRDRGWRYGLCCPNNLEYREFVVEQIREIARSFPDLDGIFYDMPYWEVDCHCPSCRTRFENEYGEQIPKEIDFNNSVFRKYMYARQDWMVDFCKFVKEKTNEILKGVTVEFNYAAVVGCDWLAGSTEGINAQSEFTGGDLYGDLYNHSFACKYYYAVSKNQPFEYMTCRCNKTLREHTITKPKNMLLKEVMLTAAHHGASLIIDAIDPKGTLNPKVYKEIGEVFKNQIPYEEYMNKGKLFSKIGVYFNSDIQFLGKDNVFTNKESVLKSLKTLIENHLPCGVVANGIKNYLKPLSLIIAPSLQESRNSLKEEIIEYVKQGGKLYLSGHSDERLTKEFFGAKYFNKVNDEEKFKHVKKPYQEVQLYVAPTNKYKKVFGEFTEEYPLPITYNIPKVEIEKGEVMGVVVLPYTHPDDNIRYVSIHSNPPFVKTQIPAVMKVKYGDGEVIWSLPSIEADERLNFKEVFKNIVGLNDVDCPFNIETSKYVESVVFNDGDDYYISFVDLLDDETVERDFKITAKSDYDAEVINSGSVFQSKTGEYQGSFKDYCFLKFINKK